MSHLNKQERTAIEAVAKHFSATLEEGNDTYDAYISVAGKRVAVDITTFKQRGPDQANALKPRLRFDKVATALIERLQAALSQVVPDGTTVLLTINAPIRLPSKTAASLEDKIQTLLNRGSLGRDAKDTIHGNRGPDSIFGRPIGASAQNDWVRAQSRFGPTSTFQHDT
jgi:hypothetical protein